MLISYDYDHVVLCCCDDEHAVTSLQASKMEQALMNQTLQVQNEKRKLESELEDVQVTKTWISE